MQLIQNIEIAYSQKQTIGLPVEAEIISVTMKDGWPRLCFVSADTDNRTDDCVEWDIEIYKYCQNYGIPTKLDFCGMFNNGEASFVVFAKKKSIPTTTYWKIKLAEALWLDNPVTCLTLATDKFEDARKFLNFGEANEILKALSEIIVSPSLYPQIKEFYE